jgi:hypothetical protein
VRNLGLKSSGLFPNFCGVKVTKKSVGISLFLPFPLSPCKLPSLQCW